MSTKPTVSSVHHELLRHETECSERWRTNFKQLEKLDNDINFIRNMMIGGIATIAITFLGFIFTLLTII
jgi:hypothetical protein